MGPRPARVVDWDEELDPIFRNIDSYAATNAFLVANVFEDAIKEDDGSIGCMANDGSEWAMRCAAAGFRRFWGRYL